MQAQQLAQRLGWLSLGLGLMELAAPHTLEQMLRIKNHSGLLRMLGARELLTGGAILSQRRPTAWVWGRVAGDAMDITLLLAALGRNRIQRSRVAAAAGVVAAITAVDLLCAQQLREGQR